jgi:hypothetical protein
LGLAVWGLDQAGPFQTIPYPGASWEPQGKPARQPHQHIRNGTAKLLTLFHPATGRVRVKGVRSCPNAVLHPWIEEQLEAILKDLPLPREHVVSPQENRASWESWQEGLTEKVTLPQELPPLRMLLVLDNLAGHKTPELLIVDVRARDHGSVHAVRSLVVEHDRVGPANPDPPGAVGATSEGTRRDHRVVRSDGAWVEYGANTV